MTVSIKGFRALFLTKYIKTGVIAVTTPRIVKEILKNNFLKLRFVILYSNTHNMKTKRRNGIQTGLNITATEDNTPNINQGHFLSETLKFIKRRKTPTIKGSRKISVFAENGVISGIVSIAMKSHIDMRPVVLSKSFLPTRYKSMAVAKVKTAAKILGPHVPPGFMISAA